MIKTALQKSLILAVSTITIISAVSNAHSGDGFGIGPADYNDGWQQCDNPYDPNCSPNGGHHGGHPGGGYPPPHEPNPPQYPGDPQYPPQYPPGNPGYGSETIDLGIYRSFYGNDGVDITRYIDMNRYYGRRIRSIIITGSAQYNSALIDVVLNGYVITTLQLSGGYSQQQRVRLNGQDLGGAASSIILRTRGNLTIERVSLVLSGY